MPPAISLAGDPGPEQVAQASNLSARADTAPAVASAAAPRAGNGESALIGAPPVSAPPPREEAAPVPAAPVVAQGAPAAQPPKAGQEAALGSGFKAWGIPPIRWGGYLALDLQTVTQQDQPRRAQLVETANLAASSYIWQPWFAQVSANATLLAAQQRGGDDNAGVSGATGGGIKSRSLTGDAQLSLFPVSRFPFTAAYGRTDSRTSGELTNNPYTGRRYTLSQAFAPLAGGSSYRASYTRSDLNSESFGTDTAKSLSGSANWSGTANALSLSGNRYSNTRTRSGDASAVDTINATHSYRPGPTLSVESLANFSDSEYRFVSGALPLDLRSRFLQFNSFATWRPTEASPLLLMGGARLFQNSAGSNGISAESTTASAHAAATYALNRNTTLSGGGTFTRVMNAGSGSLFSYLNAGIDHGSDIVQWGPYGYAWNAGTNIGIQHGGDANKTTLGARFGHRLIRNIALGEGSSLFVNATQNYSWIDDSALSTSQSVLHGAGVSWSRRVGESATTLLGVDASDSRTWGSSAQHFQLLNVLATGRMQFSRWSSGSANVTLQVTRQGTPDAFATASGVPPIGRSSVTTSGNLGYQHTRAFGVPRMSYYALLNLNQQQQRTRLEGDINAPPEQVNWSFEQRLDYVVGRLELRLSMRVADIEGRTNSLIFLRALRRFGN